MASSCLLLSGRRRPSTSQVWAQSSLHVLRGSCPPKAAWPAEAAAGVRVIGRATLLRETQLCSLHFPEQGTQEYGFHFFQKSQLLTIALETGVHCCCYKLCFVSSFKSRIDSFEAMVYTALISQFTRSSFSRGSKQRGKLV